MREGVRALVWIVAFPIAAVVALRFLSNYVDALTDIWIRGAVLLVLAFALGSLRVWEKRRRAELPEGVEVKKYPPGCLCIPGAMTDHPRCPHHDGERDGGSFR